MRVIRPLLLVVGVIAFLAALPASDALAKRPHIMKGCTVCHTETPGVVRGKLVNHSEKFRSIQLDVGPLVWIITYDDKTSLKGSDALAGIPRGKEMAITYTGPEDKALATQISVKQPYTLPKEQELSPAEMQGLMEKGPMAGGFVLVDARPPDAYEEGHLPGAVNLPYPAFQKKYSQVLPKDRNTQVIFYCGGNT